MGFVPKWSRLALSVLVTAGCGKTAADKDERSLLDETSATSETEIAAQSADNGTSQYQVYAASGTTQVVRAPTGKRISGTSLYFPPTSFDIDQQVRLDESRSLATPAHLTQLLGEEAAVEAAGPAVSVSWTYDQDTYVPFRMSVPLPAGVAAKNVAVFYLQNRPDVDTNRLGILSGASLKIENGTVAFFSKSFGIYQAVILSKAPTAQKEVQSDAKIEGAGTGSTPLAFKVEPVTGTLFGKSVRLKWALSDFSDSYSVLLSSKDNNCSEPYSVTEGIKTLSSTVTFKADEDNFVCVVAKNAVGEMRAENSGMKLVADVTPPPRPTKPTAEGGTTLNTINIRLSWGAVTDIGPAGLSQYFVQIGTTPGGNDILNSGVGDEPQRLLIGENGDTYYVRVKAIDAVGNESDWSDSSDPIKVEIP